MDEFDSLCCKVEPHFDKKFDGLPRNLREALEKIISKLEWNRSSPQQRARTLFWHDLRRDPTTDRAALAPHDTFADEAERLARELIATARARWNLKVERTVEIHRFITKKNIRSRVVGDGLVTTDVGDLSAFQRAFRIWFWQWWREHNKTAPSRNDVYMRFGRPRGIARRPSIELLELVRGDVRQKVGQKGTSKRAKQPTK